MEEQLAEPQLSRFGMGFLGLALAALGLAAMLTSVTYSCDPEPAAGPGSDQEDEGIPGETPLLAAVREGDLDATATLVRAGADVNEGGDLRPADVEALFMVGPDELRPDLPDERGNVPPLLVAALNEDRPMVTSLLLAGADPDLAAFGAYTPVYVGAALGSTPIVSTVVNAGGNPVPETPNNPLTPADAARLAGKEDIADLLDVVTFAQ